MYFKLQLLHMLTVYQLIQLFLQGMEFTSRQSARPQHRGADRLQNEEPKRQSKSSTVTHAQNALKPLLDVKYEISSASSFFQSKSIQSLKCFCKCVGPWHASQTNPSSHPYISIKSGENSQNRCVMVLSVIS